MGGTAGNQLDEAECGDGMAPSPASPDGQEARPAAASTGGVWAACELSRACAPWVKEAVH